MRPVKAHYIWGVGLMLVLVLGSAGMVQARSLDSREEAALFSLSDLGPVDLSPKTVTVEVYVAPEAELADCRRMLALVWEQVAQFYARMGVNLVQAPGQAQPGVLAPAKRLRIELLPDRQWLKRSFKAFDVAPPFQLRFLQVCLDKCAFAHLQLSTIHVSFKRFKKAEFSTDPKDAGLNRHWMANLLIHELGHLLGLYHSFEFTDDPVALEAGATKTPNFMSHDIAFKSSLGCVDFQKRLIHSYLGGGRVFQQYQQVNFDALSYLEQVKRYNGYKEPPPSKTAKAGKISFRIKSDKIRTFDDDDEDDEDGDDGVV
ncbi:MAG: hypothetical protein KJ822_08245 [Proteobacteria bacterium]|nr:hypothetical protein [Pseudomonadota bacterium]